jgi:ribokinase
MRAAVIGHVEWTRLVGVERVPAAGEITHAHIIWEGPAGGGGVAAVQLARLTGDCTFFTALGDDAVGRRSRRELQRLGVRVESATRAEPTREAVSLVDARGERTTLTFGPRPQPRGGDALPWGQLSGCDIAYFAAGDAAALHEARRAAVLVATTRELATVAAAGVRADALVGSRRDAAECCEDANAAALLVMTDGARGGVFRTRGGERGEYRAAAVPGRVIDSYGVGDSFAAALGFALGSDMPLPEALDLAARCGAACVTWRGPFDGRVDPKRNGRRPPRGRFVPLRGDARPAGTGRSAADGPEPELGEQIAQRELRERAEH